MRGGGGQNRFRRGHDWYDVQPEAVPLPIFPLFNRGLACGQRHRPGHLLKCQWLHQERQTVPDGKINKIIVSTLLFV